MDPRPPDEPIDFEAALYPPSKERDDVPSQRKGFMNKVRALLGIQDPTTKPPKRRGGLQSNVPALVSVEKLPEKLMLSATTGIDDAHWNNPTDGAQAEIIPQAGAYIHDMSVSPDGSEFVTSNRDGSLTFYNTTTGAAVRTIADRQVYSPNIEYSSDGTKVITAGSDKTVHIRNTKTGELLQSFTFDGICGTAIFSPDGKYAMVGVHERGMHLLNLQTGADTVLCPSGGMPFSAFSADSSTVAITCGRSIQLYSTTTFQNVMTLNGLQEVSYIAAFDPTGKFVAAGDNAGHVGMWNTTTGQLLNLTSDHQGYPNAVAGLRSLAFSHGGLAVAAGDYNGKVIIYDVSGLGTGVTPPIASQFQAGREPWGMEFSSTDTVLTFTSMQSGNVSMVQVLSVPEALRMAPVPEPESDPEPDPEEPPVEESPLINDLQALMEEASISLIVAKSFVTTEYREQSQGNWQYQGTKFNVRFSNPGDMTVMHVVINNPDGSKRTIDENINHENGTLDSNWNFSLEPQTNGGNKRVTITLYGDVAKTQVLDVIQCNYDADHNNGQILSEQIAWDDPQEGLLETEPITPGMSVVKITGTNVLLSVQSPYDQSEITFDTGGLLSHQRLTHEGGTPFNLSQVTFDSSQPTGQYILKLYDRAHGKVLDTIIFDWNRTTHTLTLTNSDDMLTLEQSEEIDSSTFDGMLTLLNANLGERQFSSIQQVVMYQETANLSGEYNLYINGGTDLMEKIFTVHPEYRSENWEAGIDAVWDQMGHSFSRSQAEQMFHNNRTDFEGKMRNALGYYEQEMGRIMEAAMNVFIQIRQGGDERQLLLVLDQTMSEARANSHLAPLGAINISIPNRAVILDAAQMLCNRCWQEMLQAEDSMRDYLLYQDRMRENNMRENAMGEWVAVSTDSGVEPDEGMSEREIRLAARIRNVLATSSDPRVVVYNNLQRDMLAVKVANGIADDISHDSLASRMLVAMNEIDAETELYLDVGGSYENTKNTLSGLTKQEIFNQAQQTYANSLRSLHSVLPIHTDTVAGQIFSGLLEAIRLAQNDADKWDAAVRLEILTDIPAQKIMDRANRASNDAAYGRLMKDLLIQAQYEDLFETHTVSETPFMVIAHPDIPAASGYSYDNGSTIRIRFDAVTHGVAIVQVEAFGTSGKLATSNGALFLDVPMNRSGDNQSVLIKITLANDQIIEIQSDTFNVRVTSQESLSVTNNTTENAMLNQLQFPLANGDWSYVMGSGYHHGTALYAIDFHLNAEDMGQPVKVAADGIIESVNLEEGKVVMRHTLPDGTIWRTTYFHMTHILEGITGIQYIGADEAQRLHLDVNAATTSRYQAQSTINTLLASTNPTDIAKITLSSGYEFAKIGSEGYSTGPHLHFQVDTASNMPVNLFHWLNKQQPGFASSGIVGGKNLTLHWDNTANALVNDEDKIIAIRSNTIINGQEIAVNEAYAWSNDLSQRYKVVWVHQLPDGRIVDSWLKENDFSKRWNSSTQIWENF